MLIKQIRIAELEKISLTAVLGDREVEQETLNVVSRLSGDLGVLGFADLLEKMETVIAEKSDL